VSLKSVVPRFSSS